MPKFNSADTFKLIDRHRVTAMIAVPAMIADLLETVSSGPLICFATYTSNSMPLAVLLHFATDIIFPLTILKAPMVALSSCEFWQSL